MPDNRQSSRTDLVRQAMNAVLEAEHHAQAELEICRKEADATMARARETAGRIQRRTQERITKLHKACEAKTAERVRAMKREAVSATAMIRADSTEEVFIRNAAANLAARLTGADDGRS